jgi:uncharacterized protein
MPRQPEACRARMNHPMGGIKAQSANLSATKMAQQGVVTLSMDLSFWVEREGTSRDAVAPDLHAET